MNTECRLRLKVFIPPSPPDGSNATSILLTKSKLYGWVWVGSLRLAGVVWLRSYGSRERKVNGHVTQTNNQFIQVSRQQG